jgi:hypothetical protein
MKKIALITLTVLVAVSIAAATAHAGNGAPSGAHYTLNLLGKNSCPGGDMLDSNRHTIFVQLYYTDDDANFILGDDPGNSASLVKTNKIFLGGGDDFQVTDGNACNKGGAAFTLPWSVATEWSVYVRELGKPGGKGDITTCGISDSGTPDDPSDDEVVCSMVNVPLERKKGKSLFRNVTTELTTLTYQVPVLDEFGNVLGYAEDTANLFDSDFYQYFWDYDNNGLRLVQLRFYPVQ